MTEGSAGFIDYMFSTKLPDRELGKLVSSGARMEGLLNISYDDFSNITITIPSPAEQDQITSFLRQFDQAITLQQRDPILLARDCTSELLAQCQKIYSINIK